MLNYAIIKSDSSISVEERATTLLGCEKQTGMLSKEILMVQKNAPTKSEVFRNLKNISRLQQTS